MANTEKRIVESLKSADKVLKERRPESDASVAIFELLRGVNLVLKPKFVFVDSGGNKTGIRYSSTLNSIFEVDQHEYDTIRLEHITLNQQTVVRDKLLRDFLLIHPHYGKRFRLVDPVRVAKAALYKTDLFDEVWFEVRALADDKLKSLLLLLTPATLAGLSALSRPELRYTARLITEKSPSEVKEAMADPILDTLHLYHMGVGLDVIKYNSRRGAIVWCDSDKEICKIPANKEPSTFLARAMLTDEYLKVRELLEQKLND